MQNIKYLLTTVLFFIVTVTYSQVKIIFDTDFGGDADDLGALAMLHNFIDNKECELVGITCWSTERYAVPAIDAVNRYYNHPDIPIGVRKGGKYNSDVTYSKSIADNLPHKLNYDNAVDATILYRELLSKSSDNSVVIVAVGPLMNIQNLINSKSDSISDLDGKELIKKKVKEFVIMGGEYPKGKKEWNFDGNMPGVTKFVINNIDLPIVFLGYELGFDIKTGEVFNQLDKTTPLYLGFRHFSEHAPWIKENFKGEILDNATYDQTAVLYAVRDGIGIYWDKVNGECIPDSSGGNSWINNNHGNHSYLKRTTDIETIEQLIESLMLNQI